MYEVAGKSDMAIMVSYRNLVELNEFIDRIREIKGIKNTETMIREFVQREVEPVAKKMDLEDYFPEKVFRNMGKMGYLGNFSYINGLAYGFSSSFYY